jgi:four helix bundle protein
VAERIVSHFDWEVHKKAFEAAMCVFDVSMRFPVEERYSMTDQVRRSSRSVCANLAEAWRRRRYKASFLNKLTDAESEAAETQTWIAFSVRCEYLDRPAGVDLHKSYEAILRMIVAMKRNPGPWLIPSD